MARRVLLWSIALVAAGALSIAGWDVLKLDRTVPQMAPANARANAVIVEKEARRRHRIRQ